MPRRTPVLRPEHQAAYDELMELFTPEELISLAERVPVAKEAWIALFPVVHGFAVSHFNEWLRYGREELPDPATDEWTRNHALYVKLQARRKNPTPKHEIAAYLAAALRGVVNKSHAQLLDIARKKLVVLENVDSILTLYEQKGACALRAIAVV